jgi:hypothetical protein
MNHHRQIRPYEWVYDGTASRIEPLWVEREFTGDAGYAAAQRKVGAVSHVNGHADPSASRSSEARS